jgi:hypothetical protein
LLSKYFDFPDLNVIKNYIFHLFRNSEDEKEKPENRAQQFIKSI